MLGSRITQALQNQEFIENLNMPLKRSQKGIKNDIFLSSVKDKRSGVPIHGILTYSYVNSLFFVVIVGIITLIFRCSIKGV
jgi:hypothetical protein